LAFIPPTVLPLAMAVVFFVVFGIYSFKSEHWLLRTILRVISTPLTKVQFRDFYLADQVGACPQRVVRMCTLCVSLVGIAFDLTRRL